MHSDLLPPPVTPTYIPTHTPASLLQVYAQMLQEGCAPNLVTYNTLIDLYVKTGQWGEAVRLLDKLEQEVGNSLGGGDGGWLAGWQCV